MEDGSLVRGMSPTTSRVLHWRVDSEFYLGLAVVDGYGGTSGEGKVQFTGFVKHPLGVVPIVGEVLVVKDWHRALLCSKTRMTCW